MNNPQSERPEPDSNNPAPEDDASFGDILSQFEQQHRAAAPGAGEPALDGVVIGLTQEAVVVDIGRKMEGVIPLGDAGGASPLKPGDHVRVTIVGRNDNGYYLLSTVRVATPKDWSGLEKAYAEKAVVSGRVEEVIKGGLRVDVGVRAFLPASRSGAREQPEMEALVGQQIECRITKLDTASEDVVVDRRVVLEERAAKAKQEAFEALREGDVVEGEVRKVTDFGAFVDVGGVEGLLHVSDMSWQRGAKPEELVRTGERVRVKILKIGREARKVSLGMKQLEPDPWVEACAELAVNQRVRGKVTRLADFGAFVELRPGVEGLIHVSEMSWSKKQRKPAEILSAGEMVEAVVLSLNQSERRIALGLKQALGDPWEEATRKYPVGSVVEGPVTSLQNFGAFLELGDGIEGMIHIGDITREKRLEHPRELLSVGKRVRAQVVEIDNQRRRIRLSMKQLEPTSADEFIAEHKAGDLVTGRVAEAGKGKAKIELGEGITAFCKLAAKPAGSAPSAGEAPADLSALTAMLEAKWKKGQALGSEAGAATEPMRAGQIRRFRIVSTDPGEKRIEVELAD